MPTRDQRVLVTGATGTQGGATARELLAAGFRVRVLTRNPDSPAAQALAGLGAEIGRGDMEDAQSLDAATKDAHGVFSVQRPEADGSDSERRHGLALIAAARRSCMNVASPSSSATSASQVARRRLVSSRGSPVPPDSNRVSGVVMFRRPGIGSAADRRGPGKACRGQQPLVVAGQDRHHAGPGAAHGNYQPRRTGRRYRCRARRAGRSR